MSISAVRGPIYSGYTAPSGRQDNISTDDALRSPATGFDRVSFSEEALNAAQRRTADAADAGEASRVSSDSAQSAPERSPSLTTLGKNSLLSMLMENLFLAELEENTADSGAAAHGAGEQPGEDGVRRPQPRPAESVRSLEDGGKVAAIKKFLNDLAAGKADFSDLPKLMAGSGGTNRKAGAGPQSEAHPTARSAAKNADSAVS